MKRLAYLLLSCATLVATSCSKDDTATPNNIQPKDYKVEYRVSSTTNAEADYISYTNATGGTSDLRNVPLPASYSFTRNMKIGDSSLLLASIPSTGSTAASNITVSILLDGKEVKKETGTGVGAQAVPVWVIGQ